MTAAVAILRGLSLCLRDGEVRSLATRPILWGVLVYALAIVGAYFSHGWFVGLIASGDPSGILGTIWYWTAWVLASVLLAVVMGIVAVVAVIAVSGPYQSAIARQVLIRRGIVVPEEAGGVTGVVREVGRTVGVEAGKLVRLLPVIVALPLLGFVPFLTPVVLVAGSWMLAFQFVDVVLDLFKVPVRERFAIARRRWLTVTLFGAGTATLFMVPFAGIVLAPAAAAGAATLFAEGPLRDVLPPTKEPPAGVEPATY